MPDQWSPGALPPRRSFWPTFFSAVVARLQWHATAIDLAPDARAWPELPDERRRRLTTLLAGFCVAEDAVFEHLEPFAAVARETSMASAETLMAWICYVPRRAGPGGQPLPHGPRGHRLRRRAKRAARRPGRRRPARGPRGRGAHRARRALAHRVRPALPDRVRALPRTARRPAGAGRGGS